MMPRIDNCIFGYEDGHRLLASSMKISGDPISELTLLSDLAPGTRFGSSDGYWTGFPVPKLDRYALMRTWPAPEMSRPGCVWTHAILFETSLFEDVDNLSRLRKFARRPQQPFDLSFYSHPVDPQAVASTLSQRDSSFDLSGRVIRILDSLYGSEEGAISVDEPGDLEDEVFAIWSQQWPRLRRNFRFQTAAGENISSLRSPFDLRLELRRASDSKPISQFITGVPSWLDTAAADLSTSGHMLRNFLWRYGKDVKKQRGSFKPLCEIYVSNFKMTGNRVESELVRSIASWFPSLDDAAALKRDIVDGEILSRYQLDFFSFILKQDKGATFPLPSSEGIKRLVDFWPEEADEMLALAEYAISEDNALALSVTSMVLDLIPRSHFWAVTRDFPNVRQRTIRVRPEVMDTDEILELDSDSLIQSIEMVPFNDPVGAALVRRLSLCASRQTAERILKHFPTFAVSELVSEANKSGSRSLREWFRVLASEPSLILDPKMMAGVRLASTLFRIGEDLGWLSPAVIRAGSSPWVAGLADTKNDLSREDRDILSSFLIALAIQVGDRGSQDILEKCFDQIHDRITQSYLPWRASEILLPRLPDVGWRRNWDTGLRLRLGIANVYIQSKLDPTSFASLTRDKRARELLAEAANELDGGSVYATSIGRF